jgi:hypothetical protein
MAGSWHIVSLMLCLKVQHLEMTYLTSSSRLLDSALSVEGSNPFGRANKGLFCAVAILTVYLTV